MAGDGISMNEATTKFAMVARQYCDWCEKEANKAHEDLLTVQILLSNLQSHILLLGLPDVAEDSEELADLVTSEEWKHVRNRLSELPIDGYWFIFEPRTDSPEEPVFGTLSDDLGDIYRDVKEGLLLFELGKIDDAIWEWRFGFDTHWGRHLTRALYVIHNYFT